jgi:hypothetical protein
LLLRLPDFLVLVVVLVLVVFSLASAMEPVRIFVGEAVKGIVSRAPA